MCNTFNVYLVDTADRSVLGTIGDRATVACRVFDSWRVVGIEELDGFGIEAALGTVDSVLCSVLVDDIMVVVVGAVVVAAVVNVGVAGAAVAGVLVVGVHVVGAAVVGIVGLGAVVVGGGGDSCGSCVGSVGVVNENGNVFPSRLKNDAIYSWLTQQKYHNAKRRG